MLTADEQVKMYSDLIRFAQRDIAELRERIAEYAYELEKSAREAALKLKK
jgi:hypothetical protein